MRNQDLIDVYGNTISTGVLVVLKLCMVVTYSWLYIWLFRSSTIVYYSCLHSRFGCAVIVYDCPLHVVVLVI